MAFLKNRGISYGNELLNSTARQGGIFPTWFSTLTLAYLGKAQPESSVGQFDWNFCNCPGI